MSVKHYKQGDPTYEAIKVIDAWQADFNIGNALKYIARHKYKGDPAGDLTKAIYYIQRSIDAYDSRATYTAGQYAEDCQASDSTSACPTISEEVLRVLRERTD
jgi:hypothetical protein